MRRFSVALLALLLLCVPAIAGASYEIDSLDIDVRIEADGAGHIEETLVYDFDDSYNGILVSIGHEGGLGLSELRVFADGIELERVETLDGVPYTYTATTEGERTSLRVFAPGGQGTRTFHLLYRLGGLAQRYLDTARLNHVFIDSASAQKNVTLRIALPGTDDARIEAFVHGAMDASALSLSGGVLTLGPGHVSAYDPLEVDILFPADWLPQARVIDIDMRAEALAREAEIAAAAEAEAARQAELARTLAVAFMIALLVYLIAAGALFLVLRGRYGLRHAIVPTMDMALLDDMTAAEAQALRSKQVDSSGLTATLLELAGLGVLRMEGEGDAAAFTRTGRKATLAPHQQALLDWLFADGDTLIVADLDAGEDAEAAQRFNEQYNAWKALAARSVQDRGWVFDNAGIRTAAMLGVPVVGLAVSMFLLRQGILSLGIGGAVVSVLLGVLMGRVRRLTDAGEARMAAIDGFLSSYLDALDTDMQAVMARAPLLMALGYMKPLAAWIDSHPYGEADDAIVPYWMLAGWHHRAMAVDSTVREAQSHNVGAQHAGDGGSSGSGGGFSGGTGGGNSYGAW